MTGIWDPVRSYVRYDVGFRYHKFLTFAVRTTAVIKIVVRSQMLALPTSTILVLFARRKGEVALMSNAGVVRRRCLLRPAAALRWSPCTVYSPAGQFHSISCSTDSPARSRHAVSTESPYKRHFCGLAVHTVKRVMGLLPGLCEKVLAN